MSLVSDLVVTEYIVVTYRVNLQRSKVKLLEIFATQNWNIRSHGRQCGMMSITLTIFATILLHAYVLYTLHGFICFKQVELNIILWYIYIYIYTILHCISLHCVLYCIVYVPVPVPVIIVIVLLLFKWNCDLATQACITARDNTSPYYVNGLFPQTNH